MKTAIKERHIVAHTEKHIRQMIRILYRNNRTMDQDQARIQDRTTDMM